MSGDTTISVKTTRFGEIGVCSSDTIFFPGGIIGFPELKKYVLIDHQDDSPFKWLQSLDDGAVAFVIVNPLLFLPDYSVDVTEFEIKALEIKDEKDAIISVIVTIPEDPSQMTANIKAPVIFNLKNRYGKQIILTKSEFVTRYKVLDGLSKRTQDKGSKYSKELIDFANQIGK